LKYSTSRSCFSAAARLEKVPRLRRFPVFGLNFREYSLYLPEASLRIICSLLGHSAGIRPGDVLERIVATDAKAMGLETPRRHFRHPGRSDTLHLSRNGRERMIVLTQRALLP
jgi:hypothetical protein